jgi:chemotaxis protein CheZ
MAELNIDSHDSSFQQEMKQLAESLLEKIEKGNLGDVVGVVNNINEVRDRTLYDEIGKLTRALHEAIKSIKTGDELGAGSDFGQASDKLSYVIEMTDKAANKTMDQVEAGMPVADSIKTESQALHSEWQKFLRKELKPEEFRDLTKRISVHLEKSGKDAQQIYGHFSEILMAQDFQDLTGQVINRVTKLVAEVETRLVDLVAMAGEVDRITGITHVAEKSPNNEQESDDKIKAEGPQIDTSVEGVVSGQDDVDDLLSSLGF